MWLIDVLHPCQRARGGHRLTLRRPRRSSRKRSPLTVAVARVVGHVAVEDASHHCALALSTSFDAAVRTWHERSSSARSSSLFAWVSRSGGMRPLLTAVTTAALSPRLPLSNRVT